MAKTLPDMVADYGELLLDKARLEDKLDDIKADIDRAKREIIQQMIDDDCSQIACGGYNYSLVEKTAYSKRSEAELEEAGVDFLDTLRSEGLGDIIVEKVDPRTLQSTIKAYVEENGELTEGLDSIIKSYDYSDISRRKVAKKK